VDPGLVKHLAESLRGILPTECLSWLPPLFNISHVRLTERSELVYSSPLFKVFIFYFVIIVEKAF
jgi:hypothetical protein